MGTLQVIIVVLIITVEAISALPIANVHLKFVSPPHVYEHGITTADGRTVAQMSYTSIGRRMVSKNPRYGERTRPIRLQSNHLDEDFVKPENAESLWPVGVFIPPVDMNDLGYSWQDSGKHMTPDFSNGLEHPDPLLLTGEKAILAVKYLYGRGELFYDDIPHARALFRNQEERRQNGLHDHVLYSLRPDSPFHKQSRNIQ